MINEFYDCTFYNSDTMIVNSNSSFYNIIAEMYFRLEVDEVEHTRILFELMDWLGAVGGVIESLSHTAVLFLGAYLSFNSALEIIHDVYHKHDHDHNHEEKQLSRS